MEVYGILAQYALCFCFFKNHWRYQYIDLFPLVLKEE